MQLIWCVTFITGNCLRRARQYQIACCFSSPEKVFGLSVGKDDSEVISIFMQTWGQLAMSGDVLGCHEWEVLLSHGG